MKSKRERWQLDEDEIVAMFLFETISFKNIDFTILYSKFEGRNPKRSKESIKMRYLNYLYLYTNGIRGLSAIKKQQQKVYDTIILKNRVRNQLA